MKSNYLFICSICIIIISIILLCNSIEGSSLKIQKKDPLDLIFTYDESVAYDSNYLGSKTDPKVGTGLFNQEFSHTRAPALKSIWSFSKSFALQNYISPGTTTLYKNDQLSSSFLFVDLRTKHVIAEKLFFLPFVNFDYSHPFPYNSLKKVSIDDSKYYSTSTNASSEVIKSFNTSWYEADLLTLEQGSILDNNAYKYGAGFETRWIMNDNLQIGINYTYNRIRYLVHRARNRPDGAFSDAIYENVLLHTELHTASFSLFHQYNLKNMTGLNSLSGGYALGYNNGKFDNYASYFGNLKIGIEPITNFNVSLVSSFTYLNYFSKNGVPIYIASTGPSLNYKVDKWLTLYTSANFKYIDKEYYVKDYAGSVGNVEYFKKTKDEIYSYSINVGLTFMFTLKENNYQKPGTLLGEDDSVKRTGGDRSASQSAGGACAGGVCGI